MERRLAAILIADVVGYGRLSQADEEGTRTRFQADLHELFEPSIALHRGRLVHTMGDAVLIEFHSIVDAVRCAVAIQRAKVGRNADIPADRRLVYRIGINLGDVIVEGQDIHGDGVNIADRLQGLAEPGGVMVSGTAYDHVKHHVEVGFEFRGEQRVKSIAEPVRVYRVLMDPTTIGKTIGTARNARRRWRPAAVGAAMFLFAVGAAAAAWLRPWEPRFEPSRPLPDKPSIAVLPFANMSGDPQQEYFADGMADDLITDLSRISGLFVIARNSAFAYKGKTIDIRQVARELGVRYVLEGSVQRAGDQVRINAQLIDAVSGGHVWADRYAGSFADIFVLQDKVTNSIADALALRLTDAEQQSFNQKDTSVPAAYDAFLRGWEHFRHATLDDYAKAIPYFEGAIRLDPQYGRAYAALAIVYAHSSVRGGVGRLGLTAWEAFVKARQYLEKAREQPTAMTHWVAGYILILSGAVPEALAEFKEALLLDPGDSWNYALTGYTLVTLGRPTEAIQYIDTAMRLDPHPPSVFLYYLGLARFSMEQFDEAAAALEGATKLNPDDQFSYLALVASYGYLGRKQDAAAVIARYSELAVRQGDVSVTVVDAPGLAFWPRVYWRTDDYRRLQEGLRLGGMAESMLTSELAERDRLTPEETRSLLLGHQLHGRDFWSGEERAASITTDGAVTLFGDWGTLDSGSAGLTGGVLRFDGDELCYRFDFVNYCGAMFRNPGGTKANENEFFWYNARGAMTFSQVE